MWPNTSDWPTWRTDIRAADQILQFIDRLPTDSTTRILFGSFDLLEDPRKLTSLKQASRTNESKNNLSTELAKDPKSKKLVDDTKDTGGNPMSFPLLEDPSIAFQLLLGQDVDLFRYDMPKFEVAFSYTQRFGPVIPPFPIFARITGSISASADFNFAYDSKGIRSGDILNGFYLDDWDAAKVDVPEFVLQGSLWAAANCSFRPHR